MRRRRSGPPATHDVLGWVIVGRRPSGEMVPWLWLFSAWLCPGPASAGGGRCSVSNSSACAASSWAAGTMVSVNLPAPSSWDTVLTLREGLRRRGFAVRRGDTSPAVSYTHLRAHETGRNL